MASARRSTGDYQRIIAGSCVPSAISTIGCVAFADAFVIYADASHIQRLARAMGPNWASIRALITAPVVPFAVIPFAFLSDARRPHRREPSIFAGLPFTSFLRQRVYMKTGAI